MPAGSRRSERGSAGVRSQRYRGRATSKIGPPPSEPGWCSEAVLPWRWMGWCCSAACGRGCRLEGRRSLRLRLWGWVARSSLDRLSAVDAGWKPALRTWAGWGKLPAISGSGDIQDWATPSEPGWCSEAVLPWRWMGWCCSAACGRGCRLEGRRSLRLRLWGWVARSSFDRLAAVDAGWKPALRTCRPVGPAVRAPRL